MPQPANRSRATFLVVFGLLLGAAPALAQDLTLTLGGDLNFNKNRREVHPRGFVDGSRVRAWSEITRGLAPLVDGDVNFANIETVVTDRNDLRAEDKEYVFRTHPNAIEHLVGLGFNLFSMANNHAYDYGRGGLAETARHMERLRARHPGIAHHGVGRLDEVRRPVILEVRGFRIAFASLGIMEPRFTATAGADGVLNYYSSSEWDRVLAGLRAADAHLKVLSVHYGTEGQVTLNAGQRAKYQKAMRDGDLDLIIGHHPHVARPVERYGRGLIFYSLGNYMMLGAGNRDGIAPPADFGLFAKLGYEYDRASRRLVATRAALLPLKSMHAAARPHVGAESQRRLRALESLGRAQLGDGQLPLRYSGGNPWGVWEAPRR